MGKRKDTSIESVGAEHLVMGFLMREGIQTYLADQRQEGYDLICINPVNRKSCLIQVKSRWATNHDHSFPLNSMNSDFIAVVFLNCGYAWNKSHIKEGGKREPKIYIIPTKTCRKYRNKSGWGKVSIKKIPNFKIYDMHWDLVKKKIK